MNRLTSWIAVVLFVLASAAAAHDGSHGDAPDYEVFKIGKNGEVKIATAVKIGDVVVKKGKYLAAHRIEADSHLLVLTAADKKTGEAVVHEIRMRLIPSKDPVKMSALFAQEQRDRSLRVTAVQIVGEPGDHVPEIGGGNQ